MHGEDGRRKPSSGQASPRSAPPLSRSLFKRIKLSNLVFGADCAKERELILVKLARWMGSGCHFLHPPLPFTFPTFSVGIMRSCLMARLDALNLLRIHNLLHGLAGTFRLENALGLIFNLALGCKSKSILSWFLGI